MSQEIMDAHNGDRGEVVVPQQNTIRKALKAVKYAIAAVCITCGMVQSTASLASTIPRRETRYGKLTLVNDTISPKLIYLIPPSGASRPRYAYLPGCTKRQLEKEYSTAWGISTDYSTTTQIREIGSGRLVGEASQTDSRGMGLRCMRREVIDKMVRAAVLKGSEVVYPQPIMQNIAVSSATLPPARTWGGFIIDGSERLYQYKNNISAIPGRIHADTKNTASGRLLLELLRQHCEVRCGVVGHNLVVNQYSSAAINEIRSNLYTRVQTIAQRSPLPNYEAWSMELTDVILNTALQRKNPDDVKTLLYKHLNTDCKMSEVVAWQYATELIGYWRLAERVFHYQAAATQYMASSSQILPGNRYTPIGAVSYTLDSIDRTGRGCAVDYRKKGWKKERLSRSGSVI
jgi:hypothetical protein